MVLVSNIGKFKQLLNTFGHENFNIGTTFWSSETQQLPNTLSLGKFERLPNTLGLGKFKQLP